MNKAILIGRLTRDPELRTTPTGRNVCQFSVAVSRNFTNANGEREADFINCVVWDKQAENLVKYQKRGNQIAVEGRIQTRNYDDKDGKKVYVTEVIATNVQFLDSKCSGSDSAVSNTQPSNSSDLNQPSTQNTSTTNVENDPFAAFGEKITINDNDLPF